MITDNEELRPKLIQLNETIVNMCYHIYRRRPTCAELLAQYTQWGINENEVKNLRFYQKQLFVVQSDPDTFFCKFLTTKLNFVQKNLKRKSIDI